MKVTLSVWWSEHHHFTHEWNPDYIEGHAISRMIDDIVELRRLQIENAQLKAAQKEAVR